MMSMWTLFNTTQLRSEVKPTMSYTVRVEEEGEEGRRRRRKEEEGGEEEEEERGGGGKGRRRGEAEG